MVAIPPGTLLAFALLAFLGLVSWYARQTHLIHRIGAKSRYRQLQRLQNTHEKWLLLKSTHHFTFEEMILDALDRKGHKVIRNKRYSGDGGIDGQVYLDGVHHFIQAKRYQGYIDQKHMIYFAATCKRAGVPGLFIHTGKMSAETKAIAGRTKIKIVTGKGLLKLFS